MEVLAARIVVALKERGHDITVVADQPTDVEAESSYHDMVVRRLPFHEVAASRDVERWAETRAKVVALKKAFRAELVWVYHINVDVMFHLTTEAAHPAPMLCTVHGAFPDGSLSASTPIGRAMRSAAWVTACSVAALDGARRQLPEIAPRSTAILNALAMPSLAPRPLAFAEPSLLCIGRLAKPDEKGFDVALRAMALVLEHAPLARLRIAGDGPNRDELERQATALGVSERVDFLGWVHPDEILALLNQSTMLLMPSRVAEGFGLVALQAAQMERPVVATNVGGVAEVVAHGETGLLVEREDHAGLASAIVTLLNDPALAVHMGAATRRRAETVFAWERHVDAYDALVRRLAGSDDVRMSAG